MNELPVCGSVLPPPVIYLVCFLAGLGLDYFWPLPVLPAGLQYSAGVLFFSGGILLFALTLREFARAKTSVVHHHPTTSVVTTGPFAFSRNPIYVSMALSFVGVAAMVDGLLIIAMVVPAVLVVNYFVVVKEEEFLMREFGDDYSAYKQSVRRWI